MEKPTNHLIVSSSPYLLQHAHNPVNWYPWGEEALQKAKSEDKPIILSIGYSACHWCHVMERESFENKQIAEIMNKHFVSIKVDREERPDIDQIYMEAVQAMGLQGGWPLNVFLTPSTEPFYGGTYFPPQNWANLLLQVARAFREKREDMEKSAKSFKEALGQSELQRLERPDMPEGMAVDQVDKTFQLLDAKMDLQHGGTKGAPKFPMPSVWQFLLKYHALTGEEKALSHALFTLDKIAMGGIYDQVGGGFARYSVDAQWFAPHFEKMLYDNGQLLSAYAHAHRLSPQPLYKNVVFDTAAFVQRELTSPEGGFYSALDADSEGEEGKFYTWPADELKALFPEDYLILSEYYALQQDGNWEKGRNILHCPTSDEAFAEQSGMALEELTQKVTAWKSKLLAEREKHIRPGLDDKILASWNGLMMKGLADAAATFQEPSFLEMATRNAEFIHSQMTSDNGQLFHNYKDGKATHKGYLEDYAAVIQGYLALYQAGFDEKWVHEARKLAEYVTENFYDPEEKLFYFTDQSAEQLIARKKEIFDNVVPASNSIMAQNFHQLGHLFEVKNFQEMASQMLQQVAPLLAKEARYLSNWACLYVDMLQENLEIAIIGDGYREMAQNVASQLLPGATIVAAAAPSALPLHHHREAIGGKTTFYVCKNKACRMPVHSVDEALQQIAEG